jgi:hypothetical protein
MYFDRDTQKEAQMRIAKEFAVNHTDNLIKYLYDRDLCPKIAEMEVILSFLNENPTEVFTCDEIYEAKKEVFNSFAQVKVTNVRSILMVMRDLGFIYGEPTPMQADTTHYRWKYSAEKRPASSDIDYITDLYYDD